MAAKNMGNKQAVSHAGSDTAFCFELVISYLKSPGATMPVPLSPPFLELAEGNGTFLSKGLSLVFGSDDPLQPTVLKNSTSIIDAIFRFK